MSKVFTTALVVFVTSSLALGDVRIRQWNPNLTTGFTIEEPIRKITITAGHPTEVFKFEAYDDVTNLPETINEITVETGAGTVLLAVIGDPSGRVAHPSRSEGWGRDSFGWKGEDSAMCGGGY
jgi:hypothetical protein